VVRFGRRFISLASLAWIQWLERRCRFLCLFSPQRSLRTTRTRQLRVARHRVRFPQQSLLAQVVFSARKIALSLTQIVGCDFVFAIKQAPRQHMKPHLEPKRRTAFCSPSRLQTLPRAIGPARGRGAGLNTPRAQSGAALFPPSPLTRALVGRVPRDARWPGRGRPLAGRRRRVRGSSRRRSSIWRNSRAGSKARRSEFFYGPLCREKEISSGRPHSTSDRRLPVQVRHPDRQNSPK